MIDHATVDKIFATANIVEVIGDFVSLKKKGTSYQACCPFHEEKTPSFSVSPAKGLYKCFGCGKGGNAIGFVMEHESMSYVEALRYVAKRYGIEITERELSPVEIKANDDRDSMMVVNSFAAEYFSKQLMHSEEGRNIGLSYFRERGFTTSILERFGLGYSPSTADQFTLAALKEGYKEDYLVRTGLTIKKESGGYFDRFSGRVMFPVHSLSGRVIAFGGRTLRTDKKVAKYLNSPESEVYHKSNTLYGIFFAKKAITQENRCILVEGYTDVLSMFQAGIENVVASSGTSLTKEQVLLIRRFTTNVTVLYDGDSAGIKASIRGIDMLLKEGLNVRVVLLPDGEDPDSFARSHSSTELNDFILGAEVDFITFKTNLLINEVKDDPIGRARVITEVVESIAVIPDDIVRSQYIKESSKLLDADIALIGAEVEKRRVGAINGKQGLEALRNANAKNSYIERHGGQNINPYQPSFSPFDPPQLFTAPHSALEELESELISYLIKYGNEDFFFEERDAEGKPLEPIKLNIAETIIEELEIDNIELKNPLYQDIFSHYKQALEDAKKREQEEELAVTIPDGGAHNDEGEVSQKAQKVHSSQFINHPNQQICNFVVDVITRDETYRPSKIWSKFDDIVVTEADNLAVAIPKTIALYKLSVIGEIKRTLASKMASQNSDEAMQTLRSIVALDESRKIICEKYSRIL